MPRYIDAEIMPSDKFWEDLTDKEKAKVLAYLLVSPTADVEEVKHGEWETDFCDYVCSVCGGHISDCALDDYSEPPYCPICGAKMDRKEQRNGQD